MTCYRYCHVFGYLSAVKSLKTVKPRINSVTDFKYNSLFSGAVMRQKVQMKW